MALTPPIYGRTYMVNRLTAAVKEAGGVRRLAQKLRLSDETVLEVLTSEKPPGPVILRALKLEPVETYREIKR